MEITYAVRDSEFEGRHIHEGEFLGFMERKLEFVGNSAEEVAGNLFRKAFSTEYELATIYYGEDVSEAQAQLLVETLSAEFPDVDVELHFGGQPVYYYLISLE